VQPDVDLAASVNAHLPKDITCLDIKRVTKSFNAKQVTDKTVKTR